MRVGPLDVSTVDEWEPAAGTLVSWHASAASLAKARTASASVVPPSYVQARHLRSLRQQAARGLDHSRLLIACGEMRGHCDLRAMTYVINNHLRRHDTYRSWFAFEDSSEGSFDGADRIVRHTIADPADIEFVPTARGERTPAQLREAVVSVPDSLQWDCFSFGIIQHADRFTFYASIDHLHADGQFVGLGLMEFQAMYAELATGKPPLSLPTPGSYDDFCLRQRDYVSTLTAESPEVRAWIDFAELNDGTFPRFPLPLGSASRGGDLMAMALLDEGQTQRFEAACVAAGARFIGGMFACIAIALHQMTGAETYFAVTPKDVRTADDLTTQGWFTGHVPVTVPVAGLPFDTIARQAQASFDAGAGLATVPFERVVELAPWLRNPPPLFSLVNFFDAQVGPLSALHKLLDGQTVAGLSDGRVTYPLSTMIGRFTQTTAAVLFPDNPDAGRSVTEYLRELTSVCVRMADGGPPERARPLGAPSAHAVSESPGRW